MQVTKEFIGILFIFLWGSCAVENQSEESIVVPTQFHASTETQNNPAPQEIDSEPLGNLDRDFNPNILKLKEHYSEYITEVKENSIIFYDGTEMLYDDGLGSKDLLTMINSPDLQDQFEQIYPAGPEYEIPSKDQDPGRVRYQPFFMKIYGSTEEEVRESLVPLIWLPNKDGRTIYVTERNGVAEQLQNVIDELDQLPEEFTPYLVNIGGSFNWRPILGTNRLSMHSFGIAIDINVQRGHYWKWINPDHEADHEYQNLVPFEIVAIFEKYGFIWGGKWYHFDTFHFEYRPELLP
jgi:peptidoglycan L-alanyl-D-glutamate endopeptidase CwlK